MLRVERLKAELMIGLSYCRSNIFILCYMFILVVSTCFAVKWWAAAVSHEVAMYYVRDWNKNEVFPNGDEWKRTQKLMQWSVKFDSCNAQYISDRGRFYEFMADTAQQAPTKRFWLIRAINDFRSASQLRPTWAVFWMNMAMAKSKLGAIDAEFELAMSNALKFGKAYPAIYVPMTEVVSSCWGLLSVQLKDKVAYQMKAALESNMKVEVLKVIKAHKMCLMLEQQGVPINHHCYDN